MTRWGPFSRESGRALLVAGALAACCLYPPLHSVHTLGAKAFFSYFSADSFYYFTIAKNSVDGLLFSYDGSTLTNGFHPLWQLILIIAYRIVGPEQPLQLAVTFWLGASFVTAGVVLFGLAIHRLTRSLLAPLWLVPGLFYVLFAVSPVRTIDPGLTYTYSVWAFMNGMESPLSILLGGVLVYFLSAAVPKADPARGTTRSWLCLGALVSLIVLARLDDVFLAAGFALFVFLRPAAWKQRLRSLLSFGAPILLLVGGYVVFSRVTFGLWMPVSGLVKSGLGLRTNFMALLTSLAPVFAPTEELEGWVYVAPRIILLVVPTVASILLLVRWVRDRGSPTTATGARVFLPLLVYVVLKSLYNFVFVPAGQQGYWYYALPVVFFNFLVVVLLYDVWARSGAKARGAVLALWALLFLVGSANTIHRVHEGSWTYDVWRARAEIRAGLLQKVPKPKLVGFYDGLFAYSFDLPTMPGTALATDRAGLEACRRNEYPEYCLSRGHDVAVWCPQGYPVFRSWIVRGRTRVVYRHPATKVTFTRVE